MPRINPEEAQNKTLTARPEDAAQWPRCTAQSMHEHFTQSMAFPEEFHMIYGTFLAVYDHRYTIWRLHAIPGTIERTGSIFDLIGLDPTRFAARLMLIGWLDGFRGQKGIRQGIGILFRCGLNHWTPVEMLFNKEAIKRGVDKSWSNVWGSRGLLRGVAVSEKICKDLRLSLRVKNFIRDLKLLVERNCTTLRMRILIL